MPNKFNNGDVVVPQCHAHSRRGPGIVVGKCDDNLYLVMHKTDFEYGHDGRGEIDGVPKGSHNCYYYHEDNIYYAYPGDTVPLKSDDIVLPVSDWDKGYGKISDQLLGRVNVYFEGRYFKAYANAEVLKLSPTRIANSEVETSPRKSDFKIGDVVLDKYHMEGGPGPGIVVGECDGKYLVMYKNDLPHGHDGFGKIPGIPEKSQRCWYYDPCMLYKCTPANKATIKINDLVFDTAAWDNGIGVVNVKSSYGITVVYNKDSLGYTWEKVGNLLVLTAVEKPCEPPEIFFTTPPYVVPTPTVCTPDNLDNTEAVYGTVLPSTPISVRYAGPKPANIDEVAAMATEKGECIMNLSKMFGVDTIGKLNTSLFKGSIHGLAIRTDSGYVAYKDGEIIDVSEFTFDGDYVFAMPATAVDVGDLVLKGSTALYVTEINEDGSLGVVNPANQSKETYLPKKTMFGFGVYVKIWSMFGNMMPSMFGGKDNPAGSLMPVVMASLLKNDGNGSTSDIDPMMLLAMSGGLGNGDMSKVLPLLLLCKGGLGSDALPLLFMMNGGDLFGKKTKTE